MRTKLIEFESIVGKHFVGEVVDDNDPAKLCRVKVMIEELFIEYEVEALPWLTCAQPVFRGQTGRKDAEGKDTPICGPIYVPRKGSRVVCIFDKGDINAGIVLWELINFSDKNDPDLLIDYPLSYGWTDENNTKVVINTKVDNPSHPYIHIHHRGCTVDIDGAGNLRVYSPTTTTIISDGDMTLTSHSKMTIESRDTMSISSRANIDVTSKDETILTGADVQLLSTG